MYKYLLFAFLLLASPALAQKGFMLKADGGFIYPDEVPAFHLKLGADIRLGSAFFLNLSLVDFGFFSEESHGRYRTTDGTCTDTETGDAVGSRNCGGIGTLKGISADITYGLPNSGNRVRMGVGYRRSDTSSPHAVIAFVVGQSPDTVLSFTGSHLMFSVDFGIRI